MEKQALWTRPFLMIIAVSLCDSMSHMMLQFMISSYAVQIGIAASLAATLVSIISVSSLVMRPVAGRLVDALNKKWLLVLSMATTCGAMVLYFFAADFWSLLIARLTHGLSYGLSTVAAITIAGALVPKDRIGSGIAIYGMGNTVSVIFGTKIAQIIIRLGGNQWMFASCLVFSAAALLLSLFLPSVDKKEREKQHFNVREVLSNLFAKQAIPFAGLSMLFSLSQAINAAFMVIYFNESARLGRNIGDPGIVMMLWGIAIFIYRPFVGKLYDRFGLAPTTVMCMGGGTLYMLLLSCTPNAVVTYLGTIVLGGLCGCSTSALQAASYEASPPEKKGAASSTNLIGSDVGSAIGGIIFGWTVTAFSDPILPLRGYQVSYILCTIPLITAVTTCVIWRNSRVLNVKKPL